jgi:hypothetical protein
MSCEVFRESLMEHARGRLREVGEGEVAARDAALAHAGVCAACGAFLEQQRALTAAMTELAAASREVPPRELESALLAGFVARRRRPVQVWMKIAAALAVVAVALGWVAISLRTQRAAPVPVAAVARAVPAAAVARAIPAPAVRAAAKAVRKRAPRPVPAHEEQQAEEQAPFVAIPYTAPLDPGERAMVVRMEMPVPALAAIGLAVAVPDPRASAQTDVLLGEDGRIRAIRLISISSYSNSDPDRRATQ